MSSRALSLSLLSALVAIPLVTSCSGTPLEETGDVGLGGTGVSGASTTGGATTGGASGATTGGAPTGGTAGVAVTGGSAGTSGAAGSATSGSAGVETGGAAGVGMGGTAGVGTGGTVGGMGGTGGSGVSGSSAGGTGGGTPPPPLDCGALGMVVENAGPPANRVNYVILPDGYTADTINTTMPMHIQKYMTRRFSANAQPYLRYRKFINICAMKIVSQANGASAGMPDSGGNTVFKCAEDRPGQNTRLLNCDTRAGDTWIAANVPASFQTDWHSIMANNSAWWNSGGPWMLFSGGNVDGPGAALHEGGHGFHQLADEYGTCTGASCGSNTNSTGTAGTNYNEVNSCGNPMTTDGKWDLWIGFNQTGATGIHSTWVNSRYVATGQYRPTANSMMNSLFCGGDGMTNCTANTGYNAPSYEKMIMDIWRNVVPIDSTVPPAGAASNPATLVVNVIDPAVINVDWSVDGTLVMANGGTTFTVAGHVPSGSHMVSAKAYDNATTDLVKYRTGGTTFGRMNWARSQQTVTWTVTVP